MPFSFIKFNKKLKTYNKHFLPFITVASALVLTMFFASKGWSTDTANNVLSNNLDAISTLTSGKIAKTGLTVGTIIGFITGVFKQSMTIVLISMGICITLSYFLQYLAAWGT